MLQQLSRDNFCLYKKRNSQIAEAWSFVSGKFFHEEGTEAKALVQKAKDSFEIPEHFLVFESGLDLQTHLRFPGQEERETLAGGLLSAFEGGYDTIVTMPNTNPFLDDPLVLKKAIGECEKRNTSSVRVLFTASATKNMEGQEMAPIEKLVEAGACAITNDGWGVFNDVAMGRLFAACANLEVPYFQHAEEHGHKGVASESAFQKKEKLNPYPRTAESAMVARDLALLRKHRKAHYHVLHISTKETVDLITKAKAEGLNITAEVTPHHLFFANTDIPAESDSRSSYFKMNPPLFTPEDREALQEALQSGVVDCVSTDHAPHELSAKQRGWALAPFGTRGLETTIPVLVHLWKQKKISLSQIEKVFSTNSRKILPQKTKASAVLFVDPDLTFTVTEKDLPGISKNSCFIGAKLSGRIVFRAESSGLYKRGEP